VRVEGETLLNRVQIYTATSITLLEKGFTQKLEIFLEKGIFFELIFHFLAHALFLVDPILLNKYSRRSYHPRKDIEEI